MFGNPADTFCEGSRRKFELFCALIGYMLVGWFRQRHPVKGGVARAIQKVRTFWNETLDSFG